MSKIFGRLFCFAIEIVRTDFVELSMAHLLEKEIQGYIVYISRDICGIKKCDQTVDTPVRGNFEGKKINANQFFSSSVVNEQYICIINQCLWNKEYSFMMKKSLDIENNENFRFFVDGNHENQH